MSFGNIRPFKAGKARQTQSNSAPPQPVFTMPQQTGPAPNVVTVDPESPFGQAYAAARAKIKAGEG
jgi:hypothetical protein